MPAFLDSWKGRDTMGELKKRAFSLELTDTETAAFIEKCFRDGTTPAEVLEGFICDLTGAERTRGSDERMYAGQYYERCGYGFFFSGEYRTFTQWLLHEYGEYSLKEIIDSLDDIKTFEEEIAYLKEHPDECEEGEIEDLEAELNGSKETIEEYYQGYTKNTTKPDTLEDGIKGVREYLEMIARIKEGGVI